MPTTYRRTNTNSGLGGGQDFNKAILDAAEDTTGSQSVSVGANSTRNSFGYTDVGVPGGDGVTGDYTVEMEVITAQNDIQMSCAVARVNSSGTQQAISSFSSEMQATAGTHTFNFTNVDLGTWASGDRLRVTYRYRNTHMHTTREISVNHGGANNEVVAPWTSTSPVVVQAVPATLTTGAQATSPLVGAPPDFVGASFVDDPVGGTNMTITKPSGVADGDVMVAFISHESGAAAVWTGPTDWVQLGTVRTQPESNHQSTTWYKVAGASEPADYTWTTDNSNQWHGGIVAYRNRDQTTPINDDTEVADANQVDPSLSVTTTVDNCILVQFFTYEDAGATQTYSHLDGMREIHMDHPTALLLGAWDEEVGAAATFARQVDYSGTADDHSGHLIALAPTSGASPVVVQAAPASLSVGAQAVTLNLTALTVQVSPAILSPTAQIVVPVLSPVAIQASPASLSTSAQTTTPVQTALTVQGSPAIITVAAQAVTPVLASVAIQASPASLITAAQATTPTQAALVIQAASASLATDAQATSPTVSGSPVTVQAAPATTTTTAQTVTPTQTAVTVTADPATLAATGQAASPQQAALVVSAEPATTTASASTVSPQVASEGVTVQAAPATLTSSAQTATPTQAALTVQADPATITATGQATQPTVAGFPVVIQAVPANVTTNAQAANVVRTGLAIQVDPATVSTAAQALVPAFDALVLQAVAASLNASASEVSASVAALTFWEKDPVGYTANGVAHSRTPVAYTSADPDDAPPW